MHYITAFTIVMNDKKAYFEEWIKYHHHLGVDHFVFYNQGEDLGSLPYSTVIPWPGRGQAVPCRNHYIANAKNDTLWAAMIDLDEFIVPHAWKNLPEMLVEFEKYGGLGINMMLFGSNNAADDDSSQIERFTRRSSHSFHDNKHIKTILQPAKATTIPCVSHYCDYEHPYYCVLSDHTRIDGCLTDQVKIDRVQLNHYFFRSRQEWIKKAAAGRPDGSGLDVNLWNLDPICNEIEDLSALHLWRSIG